MAAKNEKIPWGRRVRKKHPVAWCVHACAVQSPCVAIAVSFALVSTALYCRARNVLQQYRLCGLIGSNFSGPLRGGGHDDLHRSASAPDTTRPSHSPPTASASVSPVIQSPCCPPKYCVCAGDERKRFIRLVRTSGVKKKKKTISYAFLLAVSIRFSPATPFRNVIFRFLVSVYI